MARLATTDPDGRPNVVPFCFAVEGDVLFSAVDEKPKRTKRLRRLDNIRARPEVTVLVDHYEEDWSGLWWVRLRGEGRVVEEGRDRAHALALLEQKYEQYRREPPTGAVIVVHVREWRHWSAIPADREGGVA